jgi:hypothetical protein
VLGLKEDVVTLPVDGLAKIAREGYFSRIGQ